MYEPTTGDHQPGGFAYRIPRNRNALSVVVPLIWPYTVLTTTAFTAKFGSLVKINIPCNKMKFIIFTSKC